MKYYVIVVLVLEAASLYSGGRQLLWSLAKLIRRYGGRRHVHALRMLLIPESL